MSDLKMDSFCILSEDELKALSGGQQEPAYSCSCNGSYVGDASSPEGCIKLCGW